MYSRVTQLEIDTMRIGLIDAAELFAAEVLPGLRDHPGMRAPSRSSRRRAKG